MIGGSNSKGLMNLDPNSEISRQLQLAVRSVCHEIAKHIDIGSRRICNLPYLFFLEHILSTCFINKKRNAAMRFYENPRDAKLKDHTESGFRTTFFTRQRCEHTTN